MTIYSVYTYQVYSKKEGSQLSDYTEVKVIAKNHDEAEKKMIKLLGKELSGREHRVSAIAEYIHDNRFN